MSDILPCYLTLYMPMYFHVGIVEPGLSGSTFKPALARRPLSRRSTFCYWKHVPWIQLLEIRSGPGVHGWRHLNSARQGILVIITAPTPSHPMGDRDQSRTWRKKFISAIGYNLWTPGPDLACQDAVMESQAIINRENNCISTSRRTRAGLNAEPRTDHFRINLDNLKNM